MSKDTLNVFIFVLITIYLGLILLFIQYLKRHHNGLWKSFAGRGFLAARDFDIDSYRFVRTAVYMLFQSGHRDLKDGKATAYVYSVRTLFVALIPLMLWVKNLP